MPAVQARRAAACASAVRPIAASYSASDLFPLDPDETLMSAEFTMSVKRGTDPDPMSHLSGVVTIGDNLEGESERAAVTEVSGCVDKVDYLVVCAATTTRGQVLKLHGELKCRAPA